MSFNGKLFLSLADELITFKRNPNLHEAYYRTAISRSYYSIHWKARKLLSNVPTTGKAHQFVIDGFKSSSDNVYKKIGKDIERLRIWRNEADYIEDKPIDNNLAETAYDLAERTHKLLDSINKD